MRNDNAYSFLHAYKEGEGYEGEEVMKERLRWTVESVKEKKRREMK